MPFVRVPFVWSSSLDFQWAWKAMMVLLRVRFFDIRGCRFLGLCFAWKGFPFGGVIAYMHVCTFAVLHTWEIIGRNISSWAFSIFLTKGFFFLVSRLKFGGVLL